MAAIFFNPQSVQPSVALPGTELGSLSCLVRRAGVATFAHARLVLAALANLLLFVWALVALAAWSLILVGLLR